MRTVRLFVLIASLALPAIAEPVRVNLEFESTCLDLDSGQVMGSCAHGSENPADWDVFIAYRADDPVRSVVFQNVRLQVEIAYLENADFQSVDATDADGATWVEDVVDRTFGGGDVILIRTDQGSRFKLGLPVESETTVRFDYERL